jgi:hypothetical protein
MPTSDLSIVNMDPEAPVPVSGNGMLLAELPPAAIEAIVETFVGSPLLHVEVRHLGGALRSDSPDHGSAGTVDEPFILFAFGLAVDPPTKMAVDEHVELLHALLAPWDSGRRYLNFTESPADPRSVFGESFDRLRKIRARYDPSELFVANHPIPLRD